MVAVLGWIDLICAGAAPPRATRGSILSSRAVSTRALMAQVARVPFPVALVLALMLVGLPSASAVTCETCKDTIAGCTGGANCPLLKAPRDNAALLRSSASTEAPDMTKLLPPDLLCTFTKTVMETLSAVARAPKGGGTVDLSSASISTATGVVNPTTSVIY
jgi:hypothetical protein